MLIERGRNAKALLQAESFEIVKGESSKAAEQQRSHNKSCE